MMKRVVKLAFGLAGALALNAGARAGDATLADDPYAMVVTRNIFALNPVPPSNANIPDANPPPKIMPNGIMSMFGELQVLFKVDGPVPPGSSGSYILSEGQRKDDFEVIKIDEKNGIVTFNNHGETQQLSLVPTTPSPVPAAPSAYPMGGPGGGYYNPGNNGFGGHPGGTGYGGYNNNPGNYDNPNLRNIPTRNVTFNAASQIPDGLTPEVQTIAIEANRETTKQQVINGDLPPLPITELTPPDAVGTGGAPLVAPTPAEPQ